MNCDDFRSFVEQQTSLRLRVMMTGLTEVLVLSDDALDRRELADCPFQSLQLWFRIWRDWWERKVTFLSHLCSREKNKGGCLLHFCHLNLPFFPSWYSWQVITNNNTKKSLALWLQKNHYDIKKDSSPSERSSGLLGWSSSTGTLMSWKSSLLSVKLSHSRHRVLRTSWPWNKRSIRSRPSGNKTHNMYRVKFSGQDIHYQSFLPF